MSLPLTLMYFHQQYLFPNNKVLHPHLISNPHLFPTHNYCFNCKIFSTNCEVVPFAANHLVLAIIPLDYFLLIILLTFITKYSTN